MNGGISFDSIKNLSGDGGFFIAPGIAVSYPVLKSRAEGNSWVVSGSDLSAGSDQSTFQAYAECAHTQ